MKMNRPSLPNPSQAAPEARQPKPNPHNARAAKLRALTPDQSQALLRWLQVDGITYAAARERLAKEFGVSVSNATLCAFWQQHCVAVRPAQASAGPDVLLDITIQSAAPVRLIIKRKGDGVTVTQKKL
jgi:hypothetical protein